MLAYAFILSIFIIISFIYVLITFKNNNKNIITLMYTIDPNLIKKYIKNAK